MPRWPFRYEALTKPTSPLRSVIQDCNIEVFPLPSGTRLVCDRVISFVFKTEKINFFQLLCLLEKIDVCYYVC